ncbi:MAG: glycosyltransferase [Coriobacteriia bacterium]|nr:glycosyltransferase [Coriobacteriia bacterium]
MDSLTVFLLVWGVWLITPVLVDGYDALSRLATVKTHRREAAQREPIADEDLPRVSIIVPAHNEAEVIDRCLTSVKAQEYPHDRLEIIVVDDGSTDSTAERVEEHVNGNGSTENGDSFRLRGRAIKVGPFSGRLTLIRNERGGKSSALNAGIEASTGDIVINIDSDVVLAHDAVRNIAAAFVRDPELGALTGNIEIDWDVLEARDANGRLILDEDGHIVPRALRPIERFLARAQFLEYLSSFDLGRRAQAITSTMYTLAGACSAFRREVLPCDCYSTTTVSEDTCLTFQLHRSGVRIGFAEDAKVYLEPVTDFDALYAQRARWTRGQLEVCGLHEDIIGSSTHGRFSRNLIPRMLLLDHTMAFPRLLWAPLLLFFPLLGYSPTVIATALIAMYIFYVAIEIVSTLSVFAIADEHTRERIEQSGLTLLFLPVYRFIVFHFRFSGFLVTLMEEQQWTIPGPMDETRDGLRILGVRSIEFATSLLGTFAAVSLRVGRVALSIFAPLLVTVVIVVGRLDSYWKRSG